MRKRLMARFIFRRAGIWCASGILFLSAAIYPFSASALEYSAQDVPSVSLEYSEGNLHEEGGEEANGSSNTLAASDPDSLSSSQIDTEGTVPPSNEAESEIDNDAAGNSPSADGEVVDDVLNDGPAEGNDLPVKDESVTDDAHNPEDPSADEDISLSYAAHVSELGWQEPVAQENVAGTVGRALAIEALQFDLTGADATDMQIVVHVSDIGWMEPCSGNEVAGTTGEGKAIEAVAISLDGNLAERFDIWYRVYASSFGWLDWASNGENAGSVGYGNPVEAVVVQLVPKDAPAPGDTEVPFKDRADDPPSVHYQAHVQNVGWQQNVADGVTAGTTGRALPVEALNIHTIWYGHDGAIAARAHVQDIGWQDWSDGSCGTTGQAKHIEAIQLKLSGEIAQAYDVWYRVHVSGIGWMGWASNGAAAGTTGKNASVEAIEIVLSNKGQSAPGPTADSYLGNYEVLKVSAYSVTGTAAFSTEGESAVVGAVDAEPLQSVSFRVDNQIRTGSISYRVRRQFGNWDDAWSSDGAQVTSLRDGKQIEGVEIELSGELADAYDVWYRVHSNNYGWSGWAVNGGAAGSEGDASGVNCLEICLVTKGGEAPGETSDAYRVVKYDQVGVVYQAHSRDIGWQPLVSDGAIAGTTGRAKPVEALRVGLVGPEQGGIEVSAHVSEIGWQDYVTAGELSGTTGRVLSIEALKVSLSGDVAVTYDVIYRVHSSEYGWLGWARNGEPAGTTGLNRPVEAFQVKLIPKGEDAPESDVPAYIPLAGVSYQSYVHSTWQPAVSGGSLSGTTGQATPITSVRLTFDSPVSGEIAYSVHVQDIGWMSDVYSGDDAGSIDKSKQIEAIKIHLTGQAENYYDVWYRAYVEEYGWLGWAKNGGQAGTGSIGYRMEAFEVRVTAKGAAAPGSTANAFRDKPIRVNAALLGVPCLMQYPELPTGCESVALTNDLNYYGFGLAKTTIADQYLPRSSTDFVTAFWGNPHSSSGNCTSAPGIVNAANAFLSQRGDSRRAYDISGASLDGMYAQIQEGNPVIVWSTIGQANMGPIYARQWYNGKEYFTVTNSHTVVLRGFDRASNLVHIADSISGYVTLDASRFNLLYSMRGAQAVVIR
ncbi:hypothetical protein B5F70_03055 [Collinsella sp. An268]|nr:hypothetical protein B5F70_03055 [Collinsella sp. An268]